MSAIGTTIAPSLRTPPPFSASPATLAALRTRRTAQRLTHSLIDGKWRQALIAGGVTQHKFKNVMRDTPAGVDASDKLLVGIGLVETGFGLHADIVAGRPVLATVPTANTAKADAIEDLRSRVLFDALYHEAAIACHADGHAIFRLARDADGEVVIDLADPEEVFPVGEPGADGQPTVWERRWIIERPDPSDRRKTLRFLRIERHRAPGGVGVIEQLAYATQGSDPLQDAAELEQVPLDRALGPGHGLADVSPTGLPHPMIVQLTNARRRGHAQATLKDGDLGLVDAMVASFSRLDRTMELHAQPKIKITEEMVVDGRVQLPEGIVDPDDVVKYLIGEQGGEPEWDGDWVLWPAESPAQ